MTAAGRWILIGLAVLLIGAVPHARAAENPAVVEKELIALEGARREAIRRQDFARLEQIYAPEFVAVAGDGQIIDRAQLFAAFRRADPTVTYASTEPRVRISGETAIFIGRLTARTAAGDTLSDARFSHVFVRRGKDWRCIAGQSTPVAR
jgi:ketosteroid isomerase-like protein